MNSTNPKNPTNRRRRLDQRLLDDGLTESRTRAQGLILAGQVRVDGRRVDKPGTPIPPGATVSLVAPEHPFVGRGGMKLRAALDAFGVIVTDMVCLDVGAGTGGFTDCLLQAGAARVIAVDVGHGHLHPRLRHNPRVTVLERANVRFLTPAHLPEPPDLVVVDVAFISLRLVLPVIADLLRPAGEIVALIKPQFEAGRGEVGKGGVIRDPAKQGATVRTVVGAAQGIGLTVKGLCASPIKGAKGNREFFVHLVKGGGVPVAGVTLDDLIERAVGSVQRPVRVQRTGGGLM